MRKEDIVAMAVLYCLSTEAAIGEHCPDCKYWDICTGVYRLLKEGISSMEVQELQQRGYYGKKIP